MTCRHCGSQTPRRCCRSCELDIRLGGRGSNTTPPTRTSTFRCTACEALYRTDGSDGCPACDSRRKRAAGLGVEWAGTCGCRVVERRTEVLA